ncbi:ABC transporter substrate-binding protein [Agaribacterium haliotis]|uniref:ABC transporter substrate-binding protein n=1 Tax=Agaribacterium haliotis TaxID=2013869 RepID=UPI000BB5379E|nr:ABC transporter substrate-binding protein [Agaribacterium haliotis]
MRIFFSVLLLSLALTARAEELIQLALQISDGYHRAQVKESLKDFEQQHPGVKVELLSYRDGSYISLVERWLEADAGPDVIYWYGGSRVRHYAQKGLIQPLNSVWSSENYRKRFSKVAVDAVMLDDVPYAIPNAIFLWAFYVRPSVLDKYGLTTPANWQQVLHACQVLHQNNHELFALGSKTPWVTHAWFDYLNLRLHGLDFYRDLLDGNVAYTDNKVLETLQHWKRLLDANCFTEKHRSYSHGQVLPRMYHGLAAMSLASAHVEMELPDSVIEDLDVAAFPEIRPGIPAYTVAPVDVYVVPSHAKMTQGLKSFLSYLAENELRAPDNMYSERDLKRDTLRPGEAAILAKTKQLIAESPGSIQYFDRDTPIGLAHNTPDVFIDFLEHRDVERCARELEQLRQGAIKAGLFD